MTDLLRDMFANLRAETPKDARPSTLQEFLETDIQTETGPWTIDGHEAFGEIVALIDRTILNRDSDTEITVLAAEQVGKTMVAIGAAVQLVADRGRNVGYFLPTKDFAAKFGRSRLKRLIAKSPYLAAQLRDKDVVDQSTLKEFNGKFLYILGLESILGAISIPMDAVFYDEVDMLPTENQEWSEGRVAASDLRVKVFVSAGYTPGGGIDSRYQEGTQHKRLFDCENRSCRAKKICLEETFPDCMAKIGTSWKRVCPECKTPLDLKKGKWVATYPERAKLKKFSFRVSSLAIGARHADHIMKRWEKAKKKKSSLAKFRCAELAMPDAGAMQPITDAELQRMESDRCILQLGPSATAERYAGMDTGDLCHFYCYEVFGNQKRLVWIEEIDSDIALERVTALIESLGVQQLVIDKKPQTVLARAIAYRFPKTVALQDFTDAADWPVVVDELHEGKTYRCVKVERNESLDAYTAEITDPLTGLLIPTEASLTSDQIENLTTFKTHHKNLQKERTVDAKGRVIDRYKKGVANHYGMAGNSARIAQLISPIYVPFSFTPIDEQQVRTSQWGAWRRG